MIFGVSKTTLNGVLALLITILTTLTAYQIPAALTPGASHVWLILTTVANLLTAILRAIVGYLQNDATNESPIADPAQLPKPASDAPQHVMVLPKSN